MRVPVLSKTTLVTLLRRLRVSGFLITIPCLAPRDVATTRLIGTAIPRAQGQAITRTAIAADKPLAESPRANVQTKNVRMERIITAGTNTAEILSVTEPILVFCAVASLTKSAI